MTVDLTVPLDDGQTTTATHYAAAGRSHSLLVLAHGAGAGHRHPFMVAVATGVASRGVDVVTFNFAYMERKRRIPDRGPTLENCFRAVVGATRVRFELAGLRLFIGGKSMGGRIATHLAAEGMDDLVGVVALGYPLHPPGKPDQLRSAHLARMSVPVLVVQGERDAFGTPSELEPIVVRMPVPVTLHVVTGADHSLAVKGRPRGEVLEGVAEVVAGWIRTQSGERQPH